MTYVNIHNFQLINGPINNFIENAGSVDRYQYLKSHKSYNHIVDAVIAIFIQFVHH